MSNVNGWGGAREGAGRPAGVPADPDRQWSKAEYDAQKARHERIKADQAEFDYLIKRGQYVERAAVVQASATAYAIAAQGLRSLRDNLERRVGLPAEVLDLVATEVDNALENVARSFKALAAEPQDGTPDE
mgnify:CR=1 FL=1